MQLWSYSCPICDTQHIVLLYKYISIFAEYLSTNITLFVPLYLLLTFHSHTYTHLHTRDYTHAYTLIYIYSLYMCNGHHCKVFPRSRLHHLMRRPNIFLVSVKEKYRDKICQISIQVKS